MGRPPIGDAPMTPAERQRRARAIAKQPSVATQPMTKAERHDLLLLVRQRERVAMADAHQYQAALMANFEVKLATIYKPQDHPVWQQAHAAAKRAGDEARANVQATFRELGIPEAWAPGLNFSWYGRGENASAERRAELRRVATTEAEKRLRIAEAAIKKASVQAQERLIASSLTSEAARAMLEGLPTPAQLMPAIDFDAIERIAAPDRIRIEAGT